MKYTDPTGMFEYSDGYSTQDSRNSTGSIGFSRTYSGTRSDLESGSSASRTVVDEQDGDPPTVVPNGGIASECCGQNSGASREGAQNGGENPITPFEVGMEWLTGNGPRHRDFTNGDTFTEMLRQHDHVAATKALVAKGIANGVLEGDNGYSLGGVQGVGKYLKDYSTLATGGATGNLAVTYLGSYGLHWEVTGINGNAATVLFTVNNSSTIQSATRPPILGYTQAWQSTVGPWLNKQLSSGPMSPTTQTFKWTETIRWGN